MDITPIINAAIALIGAIIAAFIVPWIKSKTTSQQRDNLITWVKIGVSAAEQIFKGTNRGAEKKAYVINFLKEQGFEVDIATVNNTINNVVEAAVKQMNNEGLIID